jgi:hypothetical protein
MRLVGLTKVIDYVNVGGPWIQISTSGGTMPYVPSSPNPMQGAFRVINGQQEVWTGTAWSAIYGHSATISLTKQGEEVMEWANKKMEQEHRAEELAKSKPAVADALDAVNHAQEQLEIILRLTEENK